MKYNVEPPLVIHADSATPETVDLDGLMIANGSVQYIGKATRQANGKYLCLARVESTLCRVEVQLTPVNEPPHTADGGEG